MSGCQKQCGLAAASWEVFLIKLLNVKCINWTRALIFVPRKGIQDYYPREKLYNLPVMTVYYCC